MSQFSVFATKDLALPDPNLAFANCECASCGTQFAVQASLAEPFCVHCGADDISVLPQPVTASVHQLVADHDPSFVTCASCDVHLVISSALEETGSLFCPCCGNHAAHASLDEGATFGAEHEGRTEVHMHSGSNIDPQAPLNKEQKPEDRQSNPAAAKRNEHNQEIANWGDLEDIDFDDDLDWEEDPDDMVDIVGYDDDAFGDHDYPDYTNQLANLTDEQLSKMLDSIDSTVASLEKTLAGVDCDFKVGDSQTVIDDLSNDKDRVSNPAAATREEHHLEHPVEASEDDEEHEEEASKKKDHKEEKKEGEHKGKDGKHMKKEEANVTNPPGAEGRAPEFNFPSEKEVFDNSVAKEKLSQTHTNPDGTDNSNNRDAYPAHEHPSVNLLDIVRSGEAGNPPIHFGRIESSILAYVGPYTVAKLDKEEVNSQYQQNFDTMQYLQAIANSVEIAGFDATLKDFGFKLLQVKAQSPEMASLHQSKVETAALKLVEAREEANLEDIKSCMAIAMTGYTKDFWQQSNPLRQELCTTLEGAGLRSAARTVNEAIASAGDSYAEAVLAKTWEILSMPVEARNAIVQAITGSTHLSARSSEKTTAAVTYSDIAGALDNPMTGVRETAGLVQGKPARPGASNSGNAVQRTVQQFRQSGHRLFNN